MSNLEENAIAAFGEEIAGEILGEDLDIVTRFDSELENQHADKIKNVWSGKQIDYTAPPKQKHNVFFGSNKSERLYTQADNRSYSEITQSATQSTMSRSDVQVAESIKENEELRNIVLELQNKFDALEKKQQTFTKTLKESIKNELTKEFEGIITGIRNDMNTAISTIETKFENSIQQYEKNALEREERFNAQTIAREERFNAQSLNNFRVVAGELLQQSNQKTPSEDTQQPVNLRGGGQ